MCPCRVFFGAGWHHDGRQMFQIKAIYKNTLAQKIEKYESSTYNDYFLLFSQDYNFFGKRCYVRKTILLKLPKGNFQKRFSGFYPLNGKSV